jgi:hypothetical protein
MSASVTTSDREPYVMARLVDSPVGEVQLTLGNRATLFLSPAEAKQVIEALTSALQLSTVTA